MDCHRRTSATKAGPLRGLEGLEAEGWGLIAGPLTAAEAPQTSVYLKLVAERLLATRALKVRTAVVRRLVAELLWAAGA